MLTWALDNEYPYCIELNSKVLQMLAGLSEEQLSAVRSDPAQAPLSDKEKTLLLFVLKAIKSPEMVERKEVETLHALGWTDQDIFDATYHGVGIVAAGILFTAFKMDEE